MSALAESLLAHKIELPDDQIEQLAGYCHALWEWNEKINLTRHTDYEKFVSRDVVDALALDQFIEPAERIIDVGSGGGVPGVVLAILRPDLEMTLSESIAKKAKALDDIVARVGLPIVVHHGRAEELLADKHYDTLVVRAVAPLVKLLRWFGPLTESFNRLLIIKGPAWVEERGEARHLGLMQGFDLRKLASYPMAGAVGESVVLQVRPKG